MVDPDPHAHIARLLDSGQQTADTSLRAKSLARARSAALPTTLTPYEWEQWYAQHGVPASHLQATKRPPAPWWRRFFGRKN